MRNQPPRRCGIRHRLARLLLAGAGTIAASPSTPASASSAPRGNVTNTDDDCDDTCDDDFDDDLIDDAIGSLVAGVADDEAAHRLATLLAHMNPFDATRAASVAALSVKPAVRRTLAAALAAPFPLVGDDFVLGQLATDTDAGVRRAALRAVRVRSDACTTSRHGDARSPHPDR